MKDMLHLITFVPRHTPRLPFLGPVIQEFQADLTMISPCKSESLESRHEMRPLDKKLDAGLDKDVTVSSA